MAGLVLWRAAGAGDVRDRLAHRCRGGQTPAARFAGCAGPQSTPAKNGQTWAARGLAILLTMTVMLGVALPAPGAEPKLTLQQAVATALEKNPARKAAVLEQRAAATGIREARAALLPQVSFSEGYVRSTDPVFVFGGKLRQNRFAGPDFALQALNHPDPFGNFGTRLMTQWQAFDSGVSWKRMLLAKQGSTVAQRQVDRSDQQLIYRVVEAYVGLLLAQRQLQVSEAAVQTSQAILDHSEAKFEAGMVVESDRLSARVNRAARQQELIRARNAVEMARSALNHEMGIALETGYEPAEVLEERILPQANEAELQALAAAHRPDVAALNLRTDMQRTEAGMAKREMGPRVNVFASVEADNPHLTSGGGTNWTTGVELQFDIFNGGAKTARLARENALAEAASARRDSYLSAVRLEVRKAYLDLDSARQQVDLARAAVAEAKESLRISQTRYEGGLSTITDLLRTGDAARNAETDYWQAVYGLQTSYANLELATGTLDANSPVVKP